MNAFFDDVQFFFFCHFFLLRRRVQADMDCKTSEEASKNVFYYIYIDELTCMICRKIG